MSYRLFMSVLVLVTAFSCTNYQNSSNQVNPEWNLIYQNDQEGRSVSGDKRELIAAVRKGYPIRIGWASRRRNDSTRSVEHVVDGEFLTIANGLEVFAQIKPFLAQRPDLTSDTLSMTMLPIQSNWILGTNGTISSVGIDYARDTVYTSAPKQFRHPLKWYAKTPQDVSKSQPLWE